MATGREDYTLKSDVNITNAEISVDVTNSELDVNITNSSITVSISGTPSVTISGTPAVTISSGNVTAAVTGSVSISGTPSVTISSGNVTAAVTGSVSISGTPSVTISSGSVTATVTGSVSIDSGSVSITSGSVEVTGVVFTSGDNTEQHKISVTDGSTQQSWTNLIKSFLFYNDGPGSVYFAFDGAATTSNFKIPSGVSLSIDIASQDTRFICDSGKTASVYCIGMY